MKKNRLHHVLQLALAGATLAINNSLIGPDGEQEITSTAGEGIATLASGVAISAVTQRPHYLVTSTNAGEGKRKVIRWTDNRVVQVKLHSTAGSVVKGSLLCLHTDGSFKLDPATGQRMVCAVAEEAKGVDSELLSASLISPLYYAS